LKIGEERNGTRASFEATTHSQSAVETHVDVDQRHERPARAKREIAQRLVHEEVDEAVAERCLADTDGKRGAGAVGVLHLALEEQRNVVEDR